MEKEESKKKTHFILVHGACHGAWCWYKLATLLESKGHRVTAPDLAASGINSKPLNEVRSFSDYSQPMMDALASIAPEEKVVLVGHSLGGISLSLAMEKFPKKISVAVFVTAVVSGQLSRILEKTGTNGFDNDLENPPTSSIFRREFMMKRLYQLCPPEDFKLATMLVRPTRFFAEEVSKDAMISDENYEPVSQVYVVCKEDQVIQEDLQQFMIEQSPVKEVKEIEGADHMVMFSKPMELCNCLLEIAQKYDSE